MNRRTKRRLIVLAAVGGVVVLAGVGGTTVRKMQRERLAETSLTEGLAAYEAKDYRTARAKLLTHLRIKGAQAEALTALGDAQRHVEEPNARHLINAKSYLQEAVILDPDNMKAREILLEIYGLLGNWQEMDEVAGELLAADPTNEQAARMRIEANLARRNTDAALAAARQLVEAQNGSIEAHLEVLRVLQRSDRGVREQREYLDTHVAPGHEGSTSLAVLRATVEFDAGLPQRAAEILLQAGNAGATDGPGARMLLDSMELIAGQTGNRSLYDQSAAWLSQWIDREDLAPHVLGVAAGRAWRHGLPNRAIDLAMSAGQTPPADESVFAWGLLGAMEVGLEGQETTVRLRERFDAAVEPDRQERAARWLEVIEAAARMARGQSASEEPLLSADDGITNRLGPDAVAAYYDALDDAARNNTTDAINRLRGLGQEPSWVRARFAWANVLLSEARPSEAARLFVRDPAMTDLPGGPELLAAALAGGVEQSQAFSADWQRILDELLALNPESPALLAASGRGALARGDAQGAREMAERLLETEAAYASISAVVFAAQLRATDAELARAIIDRLAETAESSRQVGAAAAGMANMGEPDRARLFLDERARAAGDSDVYDWKLARIQLASTIDDAQSLETLEQVSASSASDSRVQLEVLRTPTIWSDLDRAGQVIARLREAQGDRGVDWRIFEARRLLERSDAIDAARAAAALLEPVLVSERGKRDTRAMLIAADAFGRAGPIESELRALAAAADGNDPMAALPRLIDRLQTLGRGDRAAERLRQFIELGDVPPRVRAMRVQLLQRQGMNDLAARDVAALASQGDARYILIAGVALRPRGSSVPLTEAEEQALASDLSPEGQINAAQLLARVGRVDEGLARLEALPETSDAGSRAVIIARYLDQEGRGDAAVASLVRHAETTGDADAWMEAARILVGQLRVDEAAQLLERAAAALPGNAAIGSFRASIDQSSSASTFDRMARFAAAASDREDASEGMRDLGDIAKRYIAGTLDVAETAAELEELTARRAALYPIWPLLIAAYEQLGRPNDAALTARRATDAMPGDPRPARDATLLLLKLQRYPEALTTAEQWRRLAPTDEERTRAQLALGVVEFWRGNTQRAIGLLEPHVELMRSDPAQFQDALRALAEALCISDRMAQAEDVLLPLAQSDVGWAAFTASVATSSPASQANTERATRWLEAITPVLSSDARGAVYLASSWMALHDRTQDTAFADRVVPLAQAAAASGADSWELQAVLATALAARQEHAQAVAAYERSLALVRRDIAPLLNNAAWLLTAELGEHGRAVGLARRAVAASDNPDFTRPQRAIFHHTLGSALLASGDSAGALGAFEDGLRLAETPSLLIGRVEALLAGNRRTEAEQGYSRLRPSESWTAQQKSRYEALRAVLGSG